MVKQFLTLVFTAMMTFFLFFADCFGGTSGSGNLSANIQIWKFLCRISNVS